MYCTAACPFCQAAERLLVDQVVEPIIMGPEGLIRVGTVMLRKATL